jgi:hypothetical protein
VKRRLSAIAAITAAAFVPASQSPARPQTTAPPEIVTVKITMTDAAFSVSPKSAPRGDMGRFILVNRGTRKHTFALGHQNRQSGSQTGFTHTLGPGQQHVLLLFLDYRGLLPYRGTLPADQKPSMRGTFKIF